ncbi:proepiregulin [Amphiprion ocellaris]|uniref:proepiregulin n=1 Tax=Amphiprion ocellaris TaxID=80972 RepID=UPI000C30EBE5|nr:proepiregulin [Amphiprion ocellaris]
MWICKPSTILSLIGVMLIWPSVLTQNVSPKLQADSSSLSAGQTEERHHVVKRMTKSCDSTFDDYCLNNGQCMLLVDINEHHCKCVGGYSGPRCGTVRLNDFVFQPLAEEQVVVVVFCVSLLIIGLAGALYFCCKWYKKNRFPRQQKRHSYKGVQAV